MGSGFDEPCADVGRYGEIPWESITATDDNSVVVKLKEPHIWALTEIFFNQGSGWMYPPEVIEQHGDVQDWKNLVGTGAFALTEYVEGSSLTWEKNPNYWDYDEKYPDNPCPMLTSRGSWFCQKQQHVWRHCVRVRLITCMTLYLSTLLRASRRPTPT